MKSHGSSSGCTLRPWRGRLFIAVVLFNPADAPIGQLVVGDAPGIHACSGRPRLGGDGQFAGPAHARDAGMSSPVVARNPTSCARPSTLACPELFSRLSRLSPVPAATAGGTVSTADDVSSADSAGCEPIEPTAIVSYDDGGKDYQYLIAGEITHMPVPPDGFRPESASDSLLERYGFMPRPAKPEDLAVWTEDMLSYQYTPIPELCQMSTPEKADLMVLGPPDPEEPEPWTDEERATMDAQSRAKLHGLDWAVTACAATVRGDSPGRHPGRPRRSEECLL
jgi:hypothetical protein